MVWSGRLTLKGIIVSEVLRRCVPKDLDIADVPLKESEEEVLEQTVVRHWLSLWLKWLLWYARISADPDPSFEDLFSCPMVPTSRTRKELKIERFLYGLIWKVWDLGLGWDLGTTPPCLMRGGEPGLRDTYLTIELFKVNPN